MKHIAVIDKQPQRSGKESVPDGAINGNGDLGIILGSSPDGMRIYLSKCDLWMGVERYDSGGLKPLGYIDIAVPPELYAQYHVEQDMDRGELRCRFAQGERCFALTVCVCKTENAVLLENTGNVPFEPILRVFEGETDGEKGTFCEADCSGIYRILAGAEYKYETHAYAALRKIGDGQWYLSAATNHDTKEPKKQVISEVSCMNGEKFSALQCAHTAAWAAFWEKSAFTVSDPALEMGWYASQYLLAGCAGNPKFPPGLYANFVTVEHPAWHSDYHLNYNYQAPFYAACSSNHVELTDGYLAPLEEFLPNGRSFAARFGCGGVLYPVGIAPKGLCTELDHSNRFWFERLFLGQKSNQIHAADIPVFRWKATRDLTYAREHAYPYVKAGLEFFEDYAVLEKGRYTVRRDATHEVPYYKKDFDPKKYDRYINDKNNALTLGMLRLTLEAGIDMAKSLDVDPDKQEKWQEMLDRLAPFATYYRWFRKAFRYTEQGQMWNNGGDVGLQHIYPAGCIGLSSERRMLKTARTTFRMKERYCWTDDNAVSSFFPMAARLGIDPKRIVRKLKEFYAKFLQQNMLILLHGGCLENCSIGASTLNEMAMQSHQGVLRLFPTWDTALDASFRDLRADGAFLVSASMQGGKVRNIRIFSEQGSVLRLLNPYKKTALQMQDGEMHISDRPIIELPTKAGDEITVLPWEETE